MVNAISRNARWKEEPKDMSADVLEQTKSTTTCGTKSSGQTGIGRNQRKENDKKGALVYGLTKLLQVDSMR